MNFKERMKALDTLQDYIAYKARRKFNKQSLFSNPIMNVRKCDEVIETACNLSEEMPDHDIEYHSSYGDSSSEFYEDLASYLVDVAQSQLNNQYSEV
tara:strand:+ start:895 stop:1185 length:291 start_codon:yes stop_codon:yes gene_type:complete